MRMGSGAGLWDGMVQRVFRGAKYGSPPAARYASCSPGKHSCCEPKTDKDASSLVAPRASCSSTKSMQALGQQGFSSCHGVFVSQVRISRRQVNQGAAPRQAPARVRHTPVAVHVDGSGFSPTTSLPPAPKSRRTAFPCLSLGSTAFRSSAESGARFVVGVLTDDSADSAVEGCMRVPSPCEHAVNEHDKTTTKSCRTTNLVMAPFDSRKLYESRLVVIGRLFNKSVGCDNNVRCRRHSPKQWEAKRKRRRQRGVRRRDNDRC